MSFTRVQDHPLANPLLVYLFRPRQIPQPSVVIFLELGLANFMVHVHKYPDPVARATLPFVTNLGFGG
jgi:hypothetical protein